MQYLFAISFDIKYPRKEDNHVCFYLRYCLILFALLAVGIGLLVLVCWALATAAGRYDCYLEKHSNKS